MENISIFKPNNLIVPQETQPKSMQNNHSNDMIVDNEEIAWAMQMKKDLEEKEARKKEELAKKRKCEEEEMTNKCSKNGEEVKVKRKTQEEKMRELKIVAICVSLINYCVHTTTRFLGLKYIQPCRSLFENKE